MASGKPESSPCIVLNGGSQTVTARLLTLPFNNGGPGSIKCLSYEHSTACPDAVGSSNSFMYDDMIVDTGVRLGYDQLECALK